MSPGPRRVLFAIPQLDRDGPDRVLFELLRALDRGRFAPSLLVSEPEGHYLRNLPADVEVHVLGPQRSRSDRYPLLRAARLVRAIRPALVFTTLRMNLTMGLASVVFPRETRLIIRQANDFTADFDALVRQRRIWHRVSRRLVIAALHRADAIVCQSAAMRDDLATVLGASAKLYAIGNPIDVDDAVAAATAKEVRRWGEPALVSAGRLTAQKGYDLLLPALAKVMSEAPGLRVRILGEGADRASLEAQRRALGLDEIVDFVGYSDAVLPTVRAADLFVLASRYEGFPNAALEALAVGTPVVLTNCPGANRDIVRADVNGELAEASDVDAFAAALRRGLARLGRFDRATIEADVRARYGVARIVEAYQALFDEVLTAA